ncbi:hypothetical protein M8J75_000370 [Diaphorina citri]|nr:hypothetical protein M8J75_000370 [Diaphorina citri]
MNTNDLISADLLPRNVPKPSSFHENALKPEVPEVSLMFENGYQYNKPNENNRQPLLEKATRSSMKMVSEALRERGSSSPGNSDPVEYSVQELSQKTTKQFMTPNKQKSKPSTPNKSNKSDRVNHVKSSSDELDNDRQNSQENRHINTESHLIEPVESYSVWKYKNQHMFVRDTERVTRKENDNYSSPTQYNRHEDEEYREVRSHKLPYKTNYEPQQVGVRNIHKLPYEQDDLPNHRMDHLNYIQGHQSPNVDYVQNRHDQVRLEDEYLVNKKPVSKSNWRNVSPMTQDNLEPPLTRYNEAMAYQFKRSDGHNSVSELCRIVEFQTKHIEFLNEQIYNLTMQNKALSNLTKHLKTLEDNRTEEMEFMKTNFEKIQQSILNMNKENAPPTNIKSASNQKTESKEKEKVDDHLDKIEKRLMDLINNKLNNMVATEPKCDDHCHETNENHDEEESSSSEDIVPVNTKQTGKQCMCACDSTKQSTKCRPRESASKVNQKSPALKNDHRVQTRHLEYQTDLLKHNGKVPKDWESPPCQSKQVMSSKKSMKKIQRKPEQEQMAINPPAIVKPGPSQPILYYQQPVYQPDKFVQNNRRLSNGGKQKKDKNKSSPDDQKQSARLKKMLKPKSQHYTKNGAHYRPESTLMNEEHSLTLNARELPVINEHIPSPEASVHIDMGEYQSSSSETDDSENEDVENREVSEESNDQEDDGAPWPTFYNNVVGKVHKLLQGNQQGNEEQACDMPDDQYRTVQVRMATIDQFKKMGISFVDDSPNSKRVTFNKTKTKLNPQYDPYTGDGAKRSPLTAVCNTNLSFASLQYLQRYHLLPTPNIQNQEQFHPGHSEINQDD